MSALRLRLEPRARRELASAGGVTALLLGLCAYAVWSASGTGDYVTHSYVGGDNPAPAIAALLHGQFGRFVDLQPVMGLTSILLRAPAVIAAHALGAGEELGYRLGALACLAPIGLGAAWLVREGRSVRPVLIVTAAAMLIAGPLTLNAVVSGHPEEPLAAALALGAVLAAQRGAVRVGAVLLGLAIATKQWALLAVVPALLALKGRRAWFLALSAAVAAPLALLVPALDPGAFLRADRVVAGFHFTNTISLWWPLGQPMAHGLATTSRELPLGLDRGRVLAAVVGLAGLGAIAIGARRERRGKHLSPLALLGALALLRAACDPAPQEYYYLGAVVALAGWEALELRRWPLAALALSVAVHLTGKFASTLSAPELNLLVWGVFACAAAYVLHVLKSRPPAPIHTT